MMEPFGKLSDLTVSQRHFLDVEVGSRESSDIFMRAVEWRQFGHKFLDLAKRRPDPTVSLDDCLKMMPKGHAYQIRENCSHDGEVIYCNAQVWAYRDVRDDGNPTFWASAPEGMPALALAKVLLKLKYRIHERT